MRSEIAVKQAPILTIQRDTDIQLDAAGGRHSRHPDSTVMLAGSQNF
jgi:hypothetical protein